MWSSNASVPQPCRLASSHTELTNVMRMIFDVSELAYHGLLYIVALG